MYTYRKGINIQLREEFSESFKVEATKFNKACIVVNNTETAYAILFSKGLNEEVIDAAIHFAKIVVNDKIERYGTASN